MKDEVFNSKDTNYVNFQSLYNSLWLKKKKLQENCVFHTDQLWFSKWVSLNVRKIRATNRNFAHTLIKKQQLGCVQMWNASSHTSQPSKSKEEVVARIIVGENNTSYKKNWKELAGN